MVDLFTPPTQHPDASRLTLYVSPRCAPCSLTKPVVQALLARCPSLQYTEVDISTEAGMRMAQAFGVQHVPTLILHDFMAIEMLRLKGGALIREKLNEVLEPTDESNL